MGGWVNDAAKLGKSGGGGGGGGGIARISNMIIPSFRMTSQVGNHESWSVFKCSNLNPRLEWRGEKEEENG